MLGNKDSAGDVAQDVFMKLYRKQMQNDEIRDTESWLFVVARNLCLNTIRDSKKFDRLDEVDNIQDNSTNPANEKLIQLRRALLSLNPQYREAIILKEYHGFSYGEIAEIIDSTIPAVRSILYRARVELREAYNKVNKMR